jgi:hypothetical protein
LTSVTLLQARAALFTSIWEYPAQAASKNKELAAPATLNRMRDV